MLILEDMHVHSTFSDGENSMEENIQRAVAVGLKRICCVDHVRVGTDWVPEMVAEVERLRAIYDIEIFCAVESKFLDSKGTLDVPRNLHRGVDFIYAADHQVPIGDACYQPRDVIDAMSSGSITPDDVLGEIVNATVSAMYRYEKAVVAHLFSVLPKIGLTESNVSLRLLEKLGRAAVATDTPIEVDERWRCPGPRTVCVLKALGVDIWYSTDSHKIATIGQYEFGCEIREALAA